MHRRNKSLRYTTRPLLTATLTATLTLALVWLLTPLLTPVVQAQQRSDYVLRRDVDLVVVHTTVVDKAGHQVTNLTKNNFTIYEDGKKQKLSRFSSEDVPVTVGLILDNSGSMRLKREKMMAGALSFVEHGNPEDEFFVVNFNSDYYLDLEGKDFTNDLKEVQIALDRTTTRGSTAFYDALRAALNHGQRGSRQKKILLMISDGMDSVSLSTFGVLYAEAKESDIGLYFIALPCTDDDDKRDCRRAKREIRKLADASGGIAYFPTSIDQVQALGHQIAQDVRNQYILGYKPSNHVRDGRYRRVEVKVNAPRRKKLAVRHRPGYYAKNTHKGSQ